MKTKVKTIWGVGMVSVGSPFVDEAIREGEDLIIEFAGKTMTIPFEKLMGKKPRDVKYKDHFDKSKNYSLYDFYWKEDKPTNVQLTLIA